jgi:2-polyprenyl-3-methyl-5-hydroxy-6-metoxy-1,4-benzoquinol methylase
METFDRHKHWENIYQNKPLEEVSWYQPTPATSLEFIKIIPIGKDAQIIDVGGGDSLLVDHLLELGYSGITVLDISETAIARAQKRLGEKSGLVKWIVSDITAFTPAVTYDLWHDRATFHFLTHEKDILKYSQIVQSTVKLSGFMVIGTFSEKGPLKCSGIEIRQYSEEALSTQFSPSFEKMECIRVVHRTPFDSLQEFTFCSFKKIT